MGGVWSERMVPRLKAEQRNELKMDGQQNGLYPDSLLKYFLKGTQCSVVNYNTCRKL